MHTRPREEAHFCKQDPERNHTFADKAHGGTTLLRTRPGEETHFCRQGPDRNHNFVGKAQEGTTLSQTSPRQKPHFWEQGPGKWKMARAQLVHTGNEYLDCFNEEWLSSHHF